MRFQELFLISRGRTTPFEIKTAVALAPAPVAAATPVAAPTEPIAPVPAAASPAPAPTPAAAAPKSAPARQEKGAQGKRERPDDVAVIELTEVISPADAKAEMGQILAKLLQWYKVNKSRNMLPKTRCATQRLTA